MNIFLLFFEVKEDIISSYGKYSPIVSIVYQLPLLLMIKYFACMED